MAIYRNDVDGKDFFVEDNGSIVLLRPVTDAAREWTDEHIPQEAMWFGDAVVVEPRYIADIVEGIQLDCLTFVLL
jgi:hypothetical protein